MMQAATVFLGHKIAFSSTQQLGGIIVSPARKMNLVEEIRALPSCIVCGDSLEQITEDLGVRWVQSDIQKRLGFGILRTAVVVGFLWNRSSCIL